VSGYSRRFGVQPAPTRNTSAVSSSRMGDKSLDKALDIKVKGNELFKQNDFEKAIELYTEAINTCPPHR
jgi:hypothetical protein